MKRHAASLVLALAALAGCGGGGDNDDGGMPSQSATDLEIIVWPSGRSGDQHKASLRCSPAGGSLKEPEEVCRRLESMERPFTRPSDDVVCTEIYGGPAVAEIRGMFRGAQVDVTFARTDGCEIELWDRHQFLFPVHPAQP